MGARSQSDTFQIPVIISVRPHTRAPTHTRAHTHACPHTRAPTHARAHTRARQEWYSLIRSFYFCSILFTYKFILFHLFAHFYALLHLSFILFYIISYQLYAEYFSYPWWCRRSAKARKVLTREEATGLTWTYALLKKCYWSTKFKDSPILWKTEIKTSSFLSAKQKLKITETNKKWKGSPCLYQSLAADKTLWSSVTTSTCAKLT